MSEFVLFRFRQLNIDPAEFACLKAIILFKPGKTFINIKCLFNVFFNLKTKFFFVH